MGRLRVGVTTGIYMAAHAEELATVIRKIGYAFTRGANAIELAADVPHEVNHTDGQDIRRIAKHQGLTLTFHGSLTTPMTVAERSDWRDADDHMRKSIRSAVFAGCEYTLFHACLHYWFELLSYTSGKLEILMCDFNGKPLSEILYYDYVHGSGKLQDWWVEYSWNTEYQYNLLILSDEERQEVSARISADYGGDWAEQQISARVRNNPKLMEKIKNFLIEENISFYEGRGIKVDEETMERIEEEVEKQLSYMQLYKRILNDDKLYHIIKDEFDKIRRDVNKELGEKQAEAQKQAIKEKVLEKMRKKNPQERRWNVENRGKYTDAYRLLAQYLFLNREKEPMWGAFVEIYEDVLKKYDYFNEKKIIELYKDDAAKKGIGEKDIYDMYWLNHALDLAERENERAFKEFFYSVVGARMIEGHMKALFRWMQSEERGGLIYELTHSGYEDADELVKIAKNMKITIEIPDSRDSKYAGLYILWRPAHLYALVKTLRKRVNKNIYITWDFEHLAGQGVDPIEEVKRTIKPKSEGGLGIKDLGIFTLSVHCNKPNPLHGHVPLEFGEKEVYVLLYMCRITGMGKADNDVYLLFERGGGQDPFKQSVDALRLMAEYLEKDVPYDKVDLRMFGMKLTAGDIERQKQIVLQHRFELIKELMQVPEEEWGWLSGVATRKGKTKEWRKNELGAI